MAQSRAKPQKLKIKREEVKTMAIKIDQRYGKLTVIEDLGMIKRPNGKNRHFWKCKCDCGNTFEVRGDCLKVEIINLVDAYNMNTLKQLTI